MTSFWLEYLKKGKKFVTLNIYISVLELWNLKMCVVSSLLEAYLLQINQNFMGCVPQILADQSSTQKELICFVVFF